jgi:hypothetical protein
MSDKKELQRIVTPKGELKLAYISSPSTKFNPDGVYTALLVLDPALDEVKEFVKSVAAIAKEHKVKNVPIKKDMDGETPTGMLIVKASSGFPPSIFDSAGNNITENSDPVGRGSIVRIAVAAKPWEVSGNTGIKFYLQGVQVLSLVKSRGQSFDSLGFTKGEGYVIQEDGVASVEEVADIIDDLPF